MKDLFNRIAKCAKNDKALTSEEFLLYIVEEVGEVSTCIAVEKKLKTRKLEEKTKSELADVIISSLGLFAHEGGTLKELKILMKKKLPKWEGRTKK